MSSSNLVHSPPTHILCLTPCIKARKSFNGVLPCLVMMYHQTNLDCKSFSISEDLAETIVVWPWTSQNYISEWYSGWWWCITILSLTNQWYCPGKHLLKSSEPSLWPWPWIQQSNLFTRHKSQYHDTLSEGTISNVRDTDYLPLFGAVNNTQHTINTICM